MKKYLLVVLFVYLLNTWGFADVLIKQKSHTAGYYYGGINNPAVDTEITAWLGEKKNSACYRKPYYHYRQDTQPGVFY